jgi:hypothetical protein
LSKVDLISKYGKLPCKLSAYTTEIDFEEILLDLQDQSKRFSKKYMKLNQEISTLIQEFSLVTFFPVDVSDKTCMSFLLIQIDKANGYFYFITVL